LTQLLIVTADPPRFADMSAEIEKQGAAVRWASSGSRALELLGHHVIDLVVADENLGDMTGLTLITQLVTVNPMINTAAVSSLSEDAYHTISEGLGILMQLPPAPNRSDGQRLMAHLNRILNSTVASQHEAKR
jgi:CheY-like chemotaxis protein